jgi:hypothetical protein
MRGPRVGLDSRFSVCKRRFRLRFASDRFVIAVETPHGVTE